MPAELVDNQCVLTGTVQRVVADLALDGFAGTADTVRRKLCRENTSLRREARLRPLR